MCQLRTYERNGGDMLELVRYKEKELSKAAGAEYEVVSGRDIIQSKKNRHVALGKYTESRNHRLSL